VGTPTLPPLPTRAAAGAALLDQRRPGWHQQVDRDRLDLEDWRADILGQLYGSFGAGSTSSPRAWARPKWMPGPSPTASTWTRSTWPC
jgi:hypothetical protein